jgi:hypothetical protein
MTREGAGRYDHLHGDEDEIAAARVERVSSCDECGSTDGCLCSVREAREKEWEQAHPRKTGYPCSLCGASPCESPTACRAQARAENEDRDEPRPDTED